jgi:ADP-ribose pyrophosphatase YjhB (NUDIX family)
MSGPDDFLKWCMRRIIKFEEVADGRYVPVCCAVVTRNNSEILLVGNDYKTGQPLVWNLPGGAVDLGEDLRHAVIRELYEESGLDVLQVGRLAWVVQIYNGPEHPSFLVFAFEVFAWQGDITLDHEDGRVRRAEFVPYAEARKRVISTIAVPLGDWLTESRNTPRIYSVKGMEDTLVESQADK